MDPGSALVLARAELDPRAMNVLARSAIDNYVASADGQRRSGFFPSPRDVGGGVDDSGDTTACEQISWLLRSGRGGWRLHLGRPSAARVDQQLRLLDQPRRHGRPHRWRACRPEDRKSVV